jgi:hypothetical protein
LRRYEARMRLPSAIFTLDDGTEVLVDQRFRPLLERPPGRSVGVPARIRANEMWARTRSQTFLDGPAGRLVQPSEDEWLAIGEAALRYFGIAP